MFLILFRMYLSGLTFLLLLQHGRDSKKSPVLCGSWLYVFCSFALIGGMKHPLFLNGMLYLPLLHAGTEKVLQRKSIRFLSVSVATCLYEQLLFHYEHHTVRGHLSVCTAFGHYRGIRDQKDPTADLKMAAAWIWGICLEQ